VTATDIQADALDGLMTEAGQAARLRTRQLDVRLSGAARPRCRRCAVVQLRRHGRHSVLLLNGEDVGEKRAARPAPFDVTLPHGAARHQETMLVEAAPTRPPACGAA
jgi:hypothetical protein